MRSGGAGRAQPESDRAELGLCPGSSSSSCTEEQAQTSQADFVLISKAQNRGPMTNPCL